MITGRGTAARLIAPTVFAVFGAAFLYPSFALAQDSEADEPTADEAAPADEAASDEPPKHPTDVTDEGVPTEAVEADDAVSEVEKAMEQVEEEIEEGLPAEFTIKFGDVHEWLRLTSGEWLKGKLKRMREHDIEFDSDKLDLVTFTWDKVDQFHSPRVNTYVFEDSIDVFGRAVVTKDKVLIETAEGVESFPRSELLAIVEGEPRERNWWSTRLSLGFSGTAGNTNQGQLNAYWDLVRADQRSRSKLSYDGSFGYANTEQTVNRHLGTIEVKLFLSRRFFLIPAASEFLNDRFQNYAFRATPGAGGGVHIFDTKKVEWDVGASLGYQYARFFSAAAGVENPQNDGFIGFRTYADFDFTDDVELEIEWRTNLVYTEIGLTNHLGSAKFSVEVTDILDLETTFKFYRTENPPPRADGSVPKKNDYEFIVSLALEIG